MYQNTNEQITDYKITINLIKEVRIMKNVKCELFKEYPDVITVKELIEMLNISKTYAYELLQTGAIPSIKVGKSYRIFKADLISYLYDRK